jgi:hypothetical protein
LIDQHGNQNYYDERNGYPATIMTTSKKAYPSKEFDEANFVNTDEENH